MGKLGQLAERLREVLGETAEATDKPVDMSRLSKPVIRLMYESWTSVDDTLIDVSVAGRENIIASVIARWRDNDMDNLRDGLAKTINRVLGEEGWLLQSVEWDEESDYLFVAMRFTAIEAGGF